MLGFSAWFDASLNLTRRLARGAGRLSSMRRVRSWLPVLMSGMHVSGTAAEFPEVSHPGQRGRASRAQASVRARTFGELAMEAGARRPDELADGLLLLMDGAFAAARMHGHDSPGGQVGAVAPHADRRTHIAAGLIVDRLSCGQRAIR